MKVNITWLIKAKDIVQQGFTCPRCKKHGIDSTIRQNLPAKFRCKCGEQLEVGTHISKYNGTTIFEQIKVGILNIGMKDWFLSGVFLSWWDFPVSW